MTDPQRLALVRGAHTAIYVVMAGSTLAVDYGGVTGATGSWLWVAGGLVLVESLVFVGAGLRCPMTAMAARYEGGRAVSDTFFPERVTRHTLQVFGPLLVIGTALLAARGVGLLR